MRAFLASLWQDTIFALRQFRKSPGFALTAIVSLALGIGATTAMFSVIQGLLFAPYPYRDAARMVNVDLQDKTGGGPSLYVSGPQYPEVRALSAVDDAILQHLRSQTLTGGRIPVAVSVGIYSPNFFDYMGVPMLLGRGFGPHDAIGSGNAPVAVLSYLFWQRQFGPGHDVIGKTIELNHALYTVIGVAPRRFAWSDCDVYLAANPPADPHDFWLCFLKLKPGASRDVAAQQIQALVDRFKAADPSNYPSDARIVVTALAENSLGNFRGTIFLLFAAVILLLAIGCANVSILLLARGSARQQELAVRVSMGARPARLMRQLLTESLLLAISGAALGVLVAYEGIRFFIAALPYYSFPHEATIALSLPVLAFCIATAILTGILSGISPAMTFSRPEIAGALQTASTRLTSAASRKTHSSLIAAQVALTLLLLAGAAAAIREFSRLIHKPLGFDPTNVLTLEITFPKPEPGSWQTRLNLEEGLRAFLATVPGVETAAFSTTYFPPFQGFRGKLEIQGKPSLGNPDAELALVDPQVFAALHIPLLSGRTFDDSEIARAAHVALVNQTFATQLFPDGDPVGRSVRSPTLHLDQPDLLQPPRPDDWLQIIGLVGDTPDDGTHRPTIPAIFVPHSFLLFQNNNVFVRTSGSPEAVLRSISEGLADAYPSVVLGGHTHTYNWWLETVSWGQERFIASLFSIFAILALALAATGLYSVVSFAVTQRKQEMGVRLAIGAPRSKIIGLVLRSTAATLAVGIFVGIALSLALGKIIQSWTGGSSREPLTLLACAIILIAVAALASILPAWRAATTDPVSCLRSE